MKKIGEIKKRKNSPEALTERALAIKGDIYRIAYNITRNSEDSNDVCQEVFFKVYSSAGKYSPLFGKSPENWIRRIARNTSLNCLRSKKRRQYTNHKSFSDEQYFDVEDTHSLSPLQELIQKEERDILLDNIYHLQDSEKDILNMYYVKGFSHEVISYMIGISKEAAKSRVHRIREKLRGQLKHL
ncbi:MAG: RNA polymerase sigma factor [Nanoarchaeota archaeon]